MKKLKYLPYPLCFKVFRIGAERKFIPQDFHINSFYGDTRFSSIPFYKQIIKL
jgi:hypothetical protein